MISQKSNDPSINLETPRNLISNSNQIIKTLIDRQESLKLKVRDYGNDGLVIDASKGDSAAAELIIKGLLGNSAEVDITFIRDPRGDLSEHVIITLENPVVPCMASQHAGLQTKFGMASGPIRAINSKEKIINLLGYQESIDGNQLGLLFLETSQEIGLQEIREIAESIGIAPKNLAVVYADTDDLVSRINTAASSIKTTLHVLHNLIEKKLPHLKKEDKREFFKGITQARGTCPIAPETGNSTKTLAAAYDAVRNSTVHFCFADDSNFELAKGIARFLPAYADDVADKIDMSALDILKEANWDISKVEEYFTVRSIKLHKPGNDLRDAPTVTFEPSDPKDIRSMNKLLTLALG